MSEERIDRDRVRVYPVCCTSEYCGKGSESCPTCPNFPILSEFKSWVARTGAVVTDPVWCPLVYTVPSTASTNTECNDV